MAQAGPVWGLLSSREKAATLVVPQARSATQPVVAPRFAAPP